MCGSPSIPPPAGFSPAATLKTGGTIYPGLIDLHNHLSYNIVPMWMAPKQFTDRDQWRRHPDYKKKMTGPLDVLGGIDGFLQAIVRYVECKLLFSGVTSSQGITLASHGNIERWYKGIVRNVEQATDEDLPAAEPRIADVKDAKEFRKLLEKEQTCYLHHLAEGIPARANKHFRVLQISPNEWAITEVYAGIHAVGLLPADFKVMHDCGGSIIWSPLSNLLLYGVTADVASAKENGLLIGLGSDWSASGSKNLLCELKVAKLYSENAGNLFTDEELVRMVTTNAAAILKWDKIGSLKAGMKADLIVVDGKGKKDDPYDKLIKAEETDITFVAIDGRPRIGVKRLMDAFAISVEQVKVGSVKRYLFLENELANVVDIPLSFKEARTMLATGMQQLPALAKKAERSSSGKFAGAASATGSGATWRIVPDHERLPDSSGRLPPAAAGKTADGGYLEGKAAPLSELLEPMDLDPPTLAEDREFFQRLALQKNVPEYLKLDLPRYYGQSISLSQVDGYVRNLSASAHKTFDFIQPLSRFYDTPGYLSITDRLTIIDQATLLLEQAYVHLPLKKARHAANPLERLAILRHRTQQDDAQMREIEFHKEMLSIFASLRDLHTTYQLPAPFNDKVAFLPFFIEEYSAPDGPRYIVSKLVGKSPSKSFAEKVEVTHWNGVPIERAIESNGNRYAGSNPTARHARGLDTMTLRPLAVMLPPDEEWVTISYATEQGHKKRITIPWLVGSAYSTIVSSLREAQEANAMLCSGYDNLGRFVQNVKRHFFASEIAVQAEATSKGAQRMRVCPSKGALPTTFPSHLVARRVEHAKREFGYIRIYSFDTDEPEALAREFSKLLRQMPPGGVILDVRGNGGGSILAAEYMLQCLARRRIESQPAEFINTELVEEICRRHSPSRTIPGLDLSPWYESIQEIKQTGFVHTLGYPITSPSTLRSFRCKRATKFLLITNALCYSATDIFAAGFKDHQLGKILGIHNNTGAGGANVWTHYLLDLLTKDAQERFRFRPLPYNADFTVAVRRTLRVGPNSGVPVEDLGVKPDIVCGMTRDDLVLPNPDLIATACEILASKWSNPVQSP